MSAPVRSVDRRFTTTGITYPGYHIAASHGVVRGLTVRNPNAGKAIMGAFSSLGGGENSTYIEMAEKARERAFLRMLEHAAAAGGNAVIGVQFTGQEILQGMTEVMAYGTAVTLVPLQQSQTQASPQQPMYGAQQYSQPAASYSQPMSPYSQPMSPYSQPMSPYSQPMAQNQFVSAGPAPMQQQFGSPAPPALPQKN